MAPLTIAVTGSAGTVGTGVMPLLNAHAQVASVIDVTHDNADVRDAAALRRAFAGADVVLHLVFITTGGAPRQTLHDVNVKGTRNALRAAADAGAKRFVFVSSVAAYGFHADNPVPLTEDLPTRPSPRFFYAKQKAQLESWLEHEADSLGLELYLVRPAIVLGSDPIGSKLPPTLAALGNAFAKTLGRSPVPLPVPAPEFPFQIVHHDDLGSALVACAVGEGPPGAYNVAADGALTGSDVARELGLLPLRVPSRVTQAAARAIASIPRLPAPVEWVEAMAHPAIMDTSKTKRELRWRPRFTASETLRATMGEA